MSLATIHKHLVYVYILTTLICAESLAMGSNCCSIYQRGEIGGSFSRCADFQVDNSYWDSSPQGYNNNLNHAPLFGVGIGLNVCPWFSVGLSGTYRSHYEYCQYQESTPDINTDVPDFLGNKKRVFDFDNISFMADFYFNRSGHYSYLKWNIYSLCIAPYVGVSVGLSKNTVYDFHTINQEQVTVAEFTSNRVASIHPYNSYNQVGWSVQAGIDAFHNSCYSLGLGYRYFDGGCLRQNNYISDRLGPNEFRFTQAPVWHGRFAAHELVGALSFYF